MIPQTFHPPDIASVTFLIVLEGLLSADNALVLAIMVRHLPRNLQRRALLYGLGGAFVFRLVAILFAAAVLKQWWLQAIGALYLLYLPIKHFKDAGGNEPDAKATPRSFWNTVVAVEITDMAFAVDSVLAGVTFVDNRKDKIWVVYLGAIFGIILLRLAAGAFVRLLERYPVLDNVAYLLVGWVGVKLAVLSTHTFEVFHPEVLPIQVPEMPPLVFWSGLLGIAGVGTWVAMRHAVPIESDPSGQEPVEKEE